MSRGVIALRGSTSKGGGPRTYPWNALASERMPSEAAYGKVRDQSLSGRLDIDTVLRMDGKVEALKNKVSKAVPPERGYRAAAVRFVQELKKALTGMFDAETVDFAREMISDTQRHDAHTVAELLAFMRKYRLMVAPADGTPGVAEKYGHLYEPHATAEGGPWPTKRLHKAAAVWGDGKDRGQELPGGLVSQVQ